MIHRLWLTAIAVVFTFGCSEASKQPTTPLASTPIASPEPQKQESTTAGVDQTDTAPKSKTVIETIESAIAMLEAKRFPEFLETFLVPEEFESLKNSGEYDRVLQNFKTKNADDLLKALKSIRGTEPRMSDDGKIARFTTTESIASQNTLAFVKVNGAWYIPNKPPSE